ncbi:MAG TPA: adenylate/guanylate cyclase domain-containing protein [Actinomycetota bacterium]|nr:adenylate/guanylate cyclase domain-containing protein [Actinomycetota bacterium]
MVRLSKAVLAALRGDPEFKPYVTGLLREKADQTGPLKMVVEAAGAIEPVLERAVRRRPSKLGKLGLRSSRLLASLATADEGSNQKLAHIARGKTVAIVFMDVAGFTTLTEERGDEAALALINRLNVLVERALRGTQGELVKQLGDGFLLAFPSASRAIRAVVGLRDAIQREHEKDESFDIKLRTAVHTGEPLIEEDDMLGHDVNLTARLLDHCRPGEIIVSEAAKEGSGQRLKSISFGKGRTKKIRGLSSKVVVFPVEVSSVDVAADGTKLSGSLKGKARTPTLPTPL